MNTILRCWGKYDVPSTQHRACLICTNYVVTTFIASYFTKKKILLQLGTLEAFGVGYKYEIEEDETVKCPAMVKIDMVDHHYNTILPCLLNSNIMRL